MREGRTGGKNMLCFFIGNERKVTMIMALDYGPLFHSGYISTAELLISLNYVLSFGLKSCIA